MKRICAVLLAIVVAGCASGRDTSLASLDKKPVEITTGSLQSQSTAQIIAAYREFLATASPIDPLYKEVTQRLADLEMKSGEQSIDKDWEKNFAQVYSETVRPKARETDEHYRQALKNYTELLKARPGDSRNDWVLYQSARAYEELGEPTQAAQMLGRLAREFPRSRYAPEATMRQAELLFLANELSAAEKAYRNVVAMGSRTQYYQQALYKLGWSIFKQERYMDALDAFIVLYDELHMQDDPFVGRAQYDAGGGEMRRDLVNVITLGFVYAKGDEGLAQFFKTHSSRTDQAVMYQYVAGYFQKQERYKEAAEVCQSFVQRYPHGGDALRFQARILDIYEQSKQTTLLWAARAQFADRFNPQSDYWKLQENTVMPSDIRARMRTTVAQLAAFHHAQAQSNKRGEHAGEAVKWYRDYLAWFRDAEDAGQMNFLLAELYFEQGSLTDAVKEYTRAAYENGDHAKAAEAAYALTVTLEKIADAAKDGQKNAWKRQTALNGLRFAKRFPSDNRVAMVLAHAAELFLAVGDGEQSKNVAEELLRRDEKSVPVQYRRAALLALAQLATQQKDLEASERHYLAAMKLSGGDAKRGTELRERWAAVTFKRAEELLAAGELADAAEGFARVMNEARDTSVAPLAHYNTATLMLKQEKWAGAVAMLEDFRTRYPKHDLISGVAEKLALVYLKTDQPLKAAAEYAAVARNAHDMETRRLAAWQSAELAAQAKKFDQAIAAYDYYRSNFHEPKVARLEADVKSALLKQQTRHPGFLDSAQIAVTSVLAARESVAMNLRAETAPLALALADLRFDAFRAIKLKLPLKKSLAAKRKAMDQALVAYGKLGELAAGEAVTAGTHRVAELYQWMGREVMESERPKKLSKDEREQYDLQLEEVAVPFEDKAIALYETNIRRAKDGIYDTWVQRSFAALKQLKPGRYSKVERGDVVFATLD